jgi:hypothetical protein
MRTFFASLVLALVLLAPAEARASYPSYFFGNYYNYPPVYNYPPIYNYTPFYTYPYVTPYSVPYVAPYSTPYIWSGRYYNTPFSHGWTYQQYNPYTNQYYYRYRVRPNWWW